MVILRGHVETLFGPLPWIVHLEYPDELPNVTGPTIDGE
jgi:hypothetical protein